MSVFLRPHRYLPTDAITNALDFSHAFTSRGQNKPELVLLASDNGWDYSLHIMMLQHLMLRHAIQAGPAMFIWATQAPGHSSWSPIERRWPEARKLFTGQHLGASAYPEGTNPFQNVEPEAQEKLEDILRKISVA